MIEYLAVWLVEGFEDKEDAFVLLEDAFGVPLWGLDDHEALAVVSEFVSAEQGNISKWFPGAFSKSKQWFGSWYLGEKWDTIGAYGGVVGKKNRSCQWHAGRGISGQWGANRIRSGHRNANNNRWR